MWSGKFLSDNNTEETTLRVLTAIISIFIALLIVSCREKTPNPNVNLRLEDFSSIRNDSYALSRDGCRGRFGVWQLLTATPRWRISMPVRFI